MNDLEAKGNQLSKDRSIHESTAIIRSNERLVGQGLYNIGQELKYIRDNKTYKNSGYSSFKDYVKGELGYSSRHARNFIKISEKYNQKSISGIGNVGVTKLLELSKIEDQEERQQFIEDNDVNDMTTRELKEEIKARKEAERRLQQERQQKQELRQELHQEKAKEPKVVEKEVAPDDYKRMKKQNRKLKQKLRQKEDELNNYANELSGLQREKKRLEEKAELNEEQANNYKQLEKQIRNLKEKKSSIYREVEAATSLSQLVVEVENFVGDKLAPVKYSRAIQELSDDEVVVGNLEEIIEVVENWCREMRGHLPNQNYTDVEVINNG